MNYMFYDATAFNQNISAWNVASVTPKPPTEFSSTSGLTAQNIPVWFPVVLYVSVGRHLDGANNNSIAYSADGLNWTSVANNIFTDHGAAVHHSAKLSRWVAVGQGTNSIAHSTNGANWTPVTNSTAIFSGSGRGVAYSAALSKWVAVGGGTNSIAHSTDGITWVGLGTNHFTGGGGLCVFYSAESSRWVAVGHGTNTSTIAHSTNGVDWTGVANSTSIFSEGGLGVAYGGSKWVAVGQGTHSIAYSTDGITWQGVANSTSIFSTRGQGVAYSVKLSRWVAVGRGTNTIAYSTNGIDWTPVTNSTSIFQTVGHGVSYNSEKSLWVAVGQGINTIAHSTDGITWTAVPNSTSIFNVLGTGITTVLKQFATPTLSGSISYSGNTASMTYTVESGVTEVRVLQADLTPLPNGTTVTTNTVSGTTATLVITSVNSNSVVFVVVAQANSTGNESAASATQTLLALFAAPTPSGSITYSDYGFETYRATMTYNVAPEVTAVSVLPAFKRFALSNSALFTTNLTGVQNGQCGTISIWWEFTDTTNGMLWSSCANATYGESCAMAKNGSNISITLRNQSTVVGNFATTSNPISGVGSYHLFASWDLSAGKYHIYVNRVAQQLSGDVTTGQTVSYATGLTRSGFGATMFDPPGNFLNGYVGLAYVNYVQYVDPATSIGKFITAGGRPVPMRMDGTDGILPTGTVPIVFMNSGNGLNIGTGGNFSSHNTVAEAPVITSLPGGASFTVPTNTVNTAAKTVSLVVQYQEKYAPINFVVVALGNSAGRDRMSGLNTLLSLPPR